MSAAACPATYPHTESRLDELAARAAQGLPLFGDVAEPEPAPKKERAKPRLKIKRHFREKGDGKVGSPVAPPPAPTAAVVLPITSGASPAPDLAGVFATVRGFVDAAYPGNTSIVVRVMLRDGRKAVLPLPPALLVGAPANTETPTERDVMDAMAEAGPGASLTGKQLARVAGYAYDAGFRRVLSSLRRAGRIVNHNPGYSLP
jgi:hypothetical protein